jgi:hypothetical protein
MGQLHYIQLVQPPPHQGHGDGELAPRAAAV